MVSTNAHNAQLNSLRPTVVTHNIPVKVAPSGRWTSRKRAALYLQRYAS